MTMMPFQATTRVAPSAIPLISAAFTKLLPRVRSFATSPLGGAIIISEVVDTIQEMVGTPDNESDKQGIHEIASAVAHLLNDPNVIVPEARDGSELPLNYFTIDLKKGRAWFHPEYFSRKSVRSSNRRGFNRGRRSRNVRTRGEVSV
tara:strand:- start:1817 stop:2257 length:441 start_codon:yes stop_codon:yes gene_type:complete